MIIKDLDELKWFFNNFRPIHLLDPMNKKTSDEEYALIIQARNKYLTEEEKKTINLRSCGVIDTSLIKTWTWPHFLSHVLYFDRPEGAYITSTDQTIPEHALAMYFMYNPRKFSKAALKTQQDVGNTIYSYLEASVNNNISLEIKRSLFHTAFAGKSAVLSADEVKNYVDIDIDVTEKTDKQVVYLKNKLNWLNKQSDDDSNLSLLNYNLYLHRGYLIESLCGYHLLVPAHYIKYIYNSESMKKADGKTSEFELQPFFKELENVKDIVKDSHNFIPLPGTSRNEFIIRVLNKEDF